MPARCVLWRPPDDGATPVLHVTGLKDRSGRYYLADLATELGPTRAPRDGGAHGRSGRWMGTATGGLGLVGSVAPADLEAVLQGRPPGAPRPVVARRGTVAAYDLTFTAPKSVSILFALSSPDVGAEVVTAHEAAVEEAMGYLSRRAVAVRRGTADERRIEPCDGPVAAAFTHGVSRALDPHLHTHVVVANMVHGRDGRWTALDGRGLFAHARAAGDLYDADLRHRLGDGLGLEWARAGPDTYELAGVGRAAVGAFSGRRAEILADLAGNGRRSNRVAWARTRAEKSTPPPESLAARWHAVGGAVGLGPGEVRGLVGRARTTGAPTIDEHRFCGRIALGADPAVARRDVVGAWASSVVQGAAAAHVERCCDQVADWGEGIGVAEPRQAPARVLAPSHLLGVLGPRPAEPAPLQAWLAGAAAVSAYRDRWGVTDRARPLGAEGPGELARLPAPRLADHLATSRLLEESRRRLGRTLGREAEPAHLGLGRG